MPWDGKFNRQFAINALRSQMIILIQLPFQFLSVQRVDFWTFILLGSQILLETFVFIAYQRLWPLVYENTKEYKYIKYQNWLV